MISIADLNHIIKYYAFRIQQRIEELEHLTYHLNYQEDDTESNQEYQFISIINKYTHYEAKDIKQVQLVRKFAERVLQIYQFFKSKSNNQNLLTIIQQRIEKQIGDLVANEPIKVSEMFSYVHLMTKRSAIIRPPAQKKRNLSKSVFKEVNKAENKISPTLSLFNIQRRATTGSHNRHNKIASVTIQKWKVEDALSSIWSGLEIDKNHLQRVKEGNQILIAKEMLKRNQKISTAIKKFEKRSHKMSTDMSEGVNKENTILSQLKVNSFKVTWASKKRRPNLVSKKRNISFKENMTTFAQHYK